MRSPMITVAMLAALAGCQPDTGAAPGSTEVTKSPVTAASESAADPVSVPAYQIDRVGLPGEGRGDYIFVDAEGRRIYVTHTALVHILDLDTLEPVAVVSGFGKAHGVALDRARGHGFASDGVANNVVMFDLTTGERLKEIITGENPDSILTDPASGMVFVFNGTTQDVSVIDPATAEVIKTIPLGDKPEFSRADGQGKVWVNLEEAAEIAELDSSTMEVVNRWKLPDCEGAAALAFDAGNRRLFSGCGNHVLKVVDADNGAIIAELPIGEDADGAEYDAKRHRVYVSNRDGAMTIVRQDGQDVYSVEQDLPTEEYAKTIAIDPVTDRIFTSTADLVWPEAVPGQKLLPDAAPDSFRLLVISEK